MTTLRTLHLCQFHFKDQDIRVAGSEISAGIALSGLDEPIAVDGGGYWQADFTNGAFGGRSDQRRDETLAWRAVNAGLAGGQRAVVRFCDRWHQPVGPVLRAPHDDGTPFDDSTLYASPGASASVTAVINGQAGGLNATVIEIAIASEKALRGGERFTYIGANGWLDRCAEIIGIEPIGASYSNFRVTFQPPIRGGIAVGDALDFDNPRCVMRRASQPTNALNMGVFSTASIQFVEDMRQPPA